MSKVPVIVLAFVMVVSLGVSGYLLFNKNESERIAQIRKKAEAGDAGQVRRADARFLLRRRSAEQEEA